MDRKTKLLGAVCLTILTLSPAKSQENQTEDFNKLFQMLKVAHSAFNGMSVTLEGGLGTIIGDTIYFQNELGRFPVQFDAGREARRKIEGCEISLFGNAPSRCIFEVDAELLVTSEYTLSEGGRITLIVYNVR